MIRNYILTFVILVMGVALPVKAAHDVESTKKSLRSQLAVSKNQMDSLRLLYDLFDLVQRKDKPEYGRKIYNLGVRMGNDEVRLDILRQLSQLTGVMSNKDSAYRMLNEEVARIPRSRAQEETALFLRMRQVAEEARNCTQEQVQTKISQLIAEEEKAKKMPINYRVLRLFTIVEYLSNGVQGDLLDEYVKMLKERMTQADFELYALNNILLTESANIYTAVDNAEEAVAADRKVLKIIDNLEKQYKNANRQYRNYKPNRFIVYRRLLSNFKALTPEEIDEYYGLILEYVNEDPDVRDAETKRPLAKMYYAMANKDYTTAIPIIQKELEREVGLTKRRRLIGWLKECAIGTGDARLEVEALRQYNDLLLEREEANATAKFRELAIRTKVNELQAEKEHLKVEKQSEEIASHKKIMTFVIVCWAIFAVLLVIFVIYWAKFRAARIRIGNFVEKLSDEREYLKETQYWDYDRKEPVKQAVGVTDLKQRRRKRKIAAMFEYILNDLLYISSIGRSTRRKFIRPVSINQLVEEEAAHVKANLPGNISLKVELLEKDIEVRTDKECLEFVLRHIFKAARRVARGGEISLKVEEDKMTQGVRFVFANSSVSVADGSEEIMFDNFMSFDRLYKRPDPGLFLVRMSALLLNSDIHLDKHYDKGSSYVFTIQREMSE